MRNRPWLKLAAAAGLALVLALGLLGALLAAPAAPRAITFDLAPIPPRSIVPGMPQVFTWTITGGTPDYVTFRVTDAAAAIVFSRTYPGGAGLAVTQYYTPAPGAVLGLYESQVRYFTMEGGSLTAGGSFCVSERGNLHVFKFDDFNGNGVQDPGEGPVPGVQVQIQAAPGALCPSEPASQFTDASGWAKWDGIAIGQYIVTEIVPAGREATLPISRSVAVAIGATTYVTFANRLPPSSVHGTVWLDSNRNGAKEVAEPALANIGISLFEDSDGDGVPDPGEPLSRQTSTALDGTYLFDLVRDGDYIVVVDEADVDLPAGALAISPVSVAVTGLAPGEDRKIDFRFDFPPTPTPTGTPTHTPTATATPTPTPANGCIVGKKIDDLHVGLPGWTIHARPRDSQGVTLTTTTDGSGDFYFAGLVAGWWTIWEELQPGWAPVTPPTFDVWVPATPPCAEVRFKNRQACAIDAYEPDDNPGQATLIAPGSVQKHTLEPPTDLDWVMFDAVAGGVYTLSTDALLGSTDTFLTLYGTDGVTLLALNDDIVPGADTRSQIIWQAPAAGRYYGRVRDFYQDGARGCLAYELSLNARFRVYLPVIIGPPPPTPTPTPTATPTSTGTPTRTPTPTATRTPVPTLPPITIQGLSHPKGIGVNRFTHELYVASRDTDRVYRVNALTGGVLNAIPVGDEPFGVAVHSSANKIYVANYRGNSLSVINGLTQAVIKTISFAPYGQPAYVAIDESANRIYVTLHEGGRLAVLNGATDTLLTTVEVGAGAFGVAVDPLVKRVYVSCRDAKWVQVIDAITNSIRWGERINLEGTPYALDVNPGLNRLYVSYAPEDDNPRQVLIYRIPYTGPSLLAAVVVGNGGADGGGGIAANPATGHVFVTNSLDNSVTVFDGTTNILLATVPVGADPQFVAVDPGLSYAFVGNRASNSISGIPDGY